MVEFWVYGPRSHCLEKQPLALRLLEFPEGVSFAVMSKGLTYCGYYLRTGENRSEAAADLAKYFEQQQASTRTSGACLCD